MNDGMYTNIRNYLEEIASTQREILKALQSQQAAPQAAQRTNTAKSKSAASKPAASATVEKQLEAETKHDVVQTGKNPPTFVETDKPVEGLAGFAQPPKTAEKKK